MAQRDGVVVATTLVDPSGDRRRLHARPGKAPRLRKEREGGEGRRRLRRNLSPGTRPANS